MPESYSRRIEHTFQSKGQLCVGIDAHRDLLLENGFDDSVSGLESFSLQLLDAISETVGIVKPQVAFFERFGSKGLAALERFLVEANSRKLFVIADGKRGDIGSTMEGYADAWLSKEAPFICDAITVNPYLGVAAMQSMIATAVERNKGLFALSATSNKESLTLQSAQVAGTTVSGLVATEVAQFNSVSTTSNGRFGNLGIVIGATVNLSEFGLQNINQNVENNRTIVLSPGFGHQGAKLSEAKRIFGNISGDVIYTVSRSALREGLPRAKSVILSDLKELELALAS